MLPIPAILAIPPVLLADSDDVVGFLFVVAFLLISIVAAFRASQKNRAGRAGRFGETPAQRTGGQPSWEDILRQMMGGPPATQAPPPPPPPPLPPAMRSPGAARGRQRGPAAGAGRGKRPRERAAVAPPIHPAASGAAPAPEHAGPVASQLVIADADAARPAPPARPHSARPPAAAHPVLAFLDRRHLRHQIVISEILQPPVSLRDHAGL